MFSCSVSAFVVKRFMSTQSQLVLIKFKNYVLPVLTFGQFAKLIVCLWLQDFLIHLSKCTCRIKCQCISGSYFFLEGNQNVPDSHEFISNRDPLFHLSKLTRYECLVAEASQHIDSSHPHIIKSLAPRIPCIMTPGRSIRFRILATV